MFYVQRYTEELGFHYLELYLIASITSIPILESAFILFTIRDHNCWAGSAPLCLGDNSGTNLPCQNTIPRWNKGQS